MSQDAEPEVQQGLPLLLNIIPLTLNNYVFTPLRFNEQQNTNEIRMGIIEFEIRKRFFFIPDFYFKEKIFKGRIFSRPFD